MKTQISRSANKITTIVIMMVLAVVLWNSQALGAPGRNRYLLLDTRIVDTTENARLSIGKVQKYKGNPLFEEDKPWEKRFDNLYANVIFDEASKPHAGTIPGALKLADIRPHKWNDVRIIARGNHFKFFINGKLASEFTDNAKSGRLDQEAIGLQIHDRGMKVEFKDIRLKRLASAPESEGHMSAEIESD